MIAASASEIIASWAGRALFLAVFTGGLSLLIYVQKRKP